MGKVRNKEGKGRGTANQKPTTSRGQRRSQNSEKYQANCARRNDQSYPEVSKGQRGQGPLKGPSKRAGGTSQESWRNIMAGK